MHTGIDLGLAVTAVVTLDDLGRSIGVSTFGKDCTETLKLGPKMHPYFRLSLYATYLTEHFQAHNVVGTVVMEWPAGRGRDLLLPIAGIYLHVAMLHTNPNKIYTPLPTTIKKVFTGSGKADKDDMIAEAFRRNYHVNSHHEADALAMALMSFEGTIG